MAGKDNKDNTKGTPPSPQGGNQGGNQGGQHIPPPSSPPIFNDPIKPNPDKPVINPGPDPKDKDFPTFHELETIKRHITSGNKKTRLTTRKNTKLPKLPPTFKTNNKASKGPLRPIRKDTHIKEKDDLNPLPKKPHKKPHKNRHDRDPEYGPHNPIDIFDPNNGFDPEA